MRARFKRVLRLLKAYSIYKAFVSTYMAGKVIKCKQVLVKYKYAPPKGQTPAKPTT